MSIGIEKPQLLSITPMGSSEVGAGLESSIDRANRTPVPGVDGSLRPDNLALHVAPVNIHFAAPFIVTDMGTERDRSWSFLGEEIP
jgi:hypothetical protein